MRIKKLSPAPSTTKTFEPKTSPAYKIRTMAGDLEAVRKGITPSAMPIIVDLPKEPIKEISDQTQKQEPKQKIPPAAKDYESEAKTFAPQETEKYQEAIKFSFPRISFEKPKGKTAEKPAEEKTGFFGWLKKEDRIKISPDESPQIKIQPPQAPMKNEMAPPYRPLIPPKPLTPPKIQPFSSPINNPIIPKQPKMEPQQQTTYAPPPGLPTMPTPPNLPFRPLTPPPPPLPTMPQMQKLPAMPPRHGLPPVQPAGLKSAESAKPKKGRLIAIVAVSVLILTFIAGEIWWFFLREKTAQTTPQSVLEILPPPQNVEPLLPEGTSETTPAISEPNIPAPVLSYAKSEIIDLETLADVSGLAGADELVRLVVKSLTASATGEEPSDAETSSSDEYADITAIVKQLKIKIPASVSREFLDDFDVFVFGGNSFDEETCAKAKNTAETCFGPRLGIAVKVSDPKKMLSTLKIWEKTMSVDLKPMVLAKVGGSSTANFQTGTYNGQSIRYKNMPINTITVEYALAGDTLIITTSKSAILKAIDSLPPAESVDESGTEP